jgi:hypothetical protein
VLPDSIPVSIWDEFKAHRKKLKKPMTEYAETLILCKLEKWRVEQGANPIDVLNESIEKGWCGVFLNGHGARRELPAERFGNASISSRPSGQGATNHEQAVKYPDVASCASCGKPLLSGFKHSSKGRVCHEC